MIPKPTSVIFHQLASVSTRREPVNSRARGLRGGTHWETLSFISGKKKTKVHIRKAYPSGPFESDRGVGMVARVEGGEVREGVLKGSGEEGSDNTVKSRLHSTA